MEQDFRSLLLVRLCYYAGFTQREIREALGWKDWKVKKYLGLLSRELRRDRVRSIK